MKPFFKPHCWRRRKQEAKGKAFKYRKDKKKTGGGNTTACIVLSIKNTKNRKIKREKCFAAPPVLSIEEKSKKKRN